MAIPEEFVASTHRWMRMLATTSKAARRKSGAGRTGWCAASPRVEVVLIEVSMVRPLAVVTSEVVTSDVATPDNLSAASLPERLLYGSESAAGLTTRSVRSEGSNVVVDSPEVFSDADDNVVLPVPE